jgi:hypothetical protein
MIRTSPRSADKKGLGSSDESGALARGAVARIAEAGEADQHHGPGRRLGDRGGRGGDDHKRFISGSYSFYKVSTRRKYRCRFGAGVNLNAGGLQAYAADYKPAVFLRLAVKVHDRERLETGGCAATHGDPGEKAWKTPIGVGLLGWLQVATSPGAYSQEKFSISANAGVTDKAAMTTAAASLRRIE